VEGRRRARAHRRRRDLLVSAQRGRAEALAEPLPALADLPTAIAMPVLQLGHDPVARTVLERHVPFVLRTGLVPAAQLTAVAEDLAAAQDR
jgi:hypothetical protein